MECSGAPWRIVQPNRTGYLAPFFRQLRNSYEGSVFLLSGSNQLNSTQSHIQGQSRAESSIFKVLTIIGLLLECRLLDQQQNLFLVCEVYKFSSAKFTVACVISQCFWAEYLVNKEVCFCEPCFFLCKKVKHSGKLNI